MAIPAFHRLRNPYATIFERGAKKVTGSFGFKPTILGADSGDSDLDPEKILTEAEPKLVLVDLPNPPGLAQRFAAAAKKANIAVAVIADQPGAHARLRMRADNPASLLARPKLVFAAGKLAANRVAHDWLRQFDARIIDIGTQSQDVVPSEAARTFFNSELAGYITVMLSGVKVVPVSGESFSIGMGSITKTLAAHPEVRIAAIFRPREMRPEYEEAIARLLAECPADRLRFIPFEGAYAALNGDHIAALANMVIAPGGSTPMTAAYAGGVPVFTTGPDIEPWVMNDAGEHPHPLVAEGAALMIDRAMDLTEMARQDDARRKMLRRCLLDDRPFDPDTIVQGIARFLDNKQ